MVVIRLDSEAYGYFSSSFEQIWTWVGSTDGLGCVGLSWVRNFDVYSGLDWVRKVKV